jgi:hypothetical protein
MVMKRFVEIVALIKLVAVEVTGLIGFLCVLGFVLYLEAHHFLVWVTQPFTATK